MISLGLISLNLKVINRDESCRNGGTSTSLDESSRTWIALTSVGKQGLILAFYYNLKMVETHHWVGKPVSEELSDQKYSDQKSLPIYLPGYFT